MWQRTSDPVQTRAGRPPWWGGCSPPSPSGCRSPWGVTIGAAVIVAILVAPKATMCACGGARLP